MYYLDNCFQVFGRIDRVWSVTFLSINQSIYLSWNTVHVTPLLLHWQEQPS